MAIITFVDADGIEQTLDTDGKFNVAFNADCMDILRAMPDKCINLIVADPPYGDGNPDNEDEHRNQRGRFDRYNDSSQIGNVERERERDRDRDRDRGTPQYNRFGGRFDRYKEAPAPIPRRREERPVEEVPPTRRDIMSTGGWHGKYLERNGSPDRRDVGGEVRKKIIAWDVAPEKEVFDELFRVSQAQIIWGGNYFELPPTRCFLIWRKLSISESFSMAMAEYAWTSFNANAKAFECAPQGKPNDPRFHATQKPIDLYRWIYGMFTKPGMTVFDPFLGSGSSRIAAYEAGLNFVGCEIDKTYFRKQEERFERMTQNISFWDGE